MNRSRLALRYVGITQPDEMVVHFSNVFSFCLRALVRVNHRSPRKQTEHQMDASPIIEEVEEDLDSQVFNGEDLGQESNVGVNLMAQDRNFVADENPGNGMATGGQNVLASVK